MQNVPVQVLLDTGVEGIILFKDRLREKMPTLALQDTNNVTIDRRYPASYVILPSVYLGPHAIEDHVFLVKSPPENVLPGVGGYLGTSCCMHIGLNSISMEIASGGSDP